MELTPSTPKPLKARYFLRWAGLVLALILSVIGVVYSIIRDEGSPSANVSLVTNTGENANSTASENSNRSVNQNVNSGVSINANDTVDTSSWKAVTFQRADHGISLKIPKEWTFSRSGIGINDAENIFWLSGSQKDSVEGKHINCSVVYHNNAKGKSLADWVNTYRENNSEKYEFAEPLIIQGEEAFTLQGLRKRPSQESDSSYVWAFVSERDKIYEFEFSSSESTLKNSTVVLEIMKSVKFINQLPFVQIHGVNKKTAVPANQGYDLKVAWLDEPKELNMVDPMISSSADSDGTRFYYKVGEIINGRYKGNYIVNILSTGGMGSMEVFRVVYDPNEKTFVYLEKHSENLSNFTTPFTYDSGSTIPELIPSKVIAIPDSSTTLVAELFEVKKWFSDYPLAPVEFTDSKVGPVYFEPTIKCYFVRMPDGMVKLYHLKPKFIKTFDDRTSFYSSNSLIPAVTWNDGKNNTKEYTFNEPTGGCGTNTCHAIFTEKELGGIEALQKAGTTSTGSTVYELKDSNSNILKDTYKNYYVPSEEEKVEYEYFTKAHPLFYWQDPFGHWVRFKQTAFLPAVECGKPVIYLYPKSPISVNVQVSPSGGFSKSEPVYPKGGWNVFAHPSGQLEYGDGTFYPYLFWEGKALNYEIPEKGFVVPRDEVSTFLNRTLHLLGLNDKESGDFMEYWVPRMQENPYYFVTFVDQNVFDSIAPLTVTPKPDSVIRVFMDYRGLGAPVTVEPLTIRTPARRGFTIVEWGGAIH